MSEVAIDKTLGEVGERFIKNRILARISEDTIATSLLDGGIGHDSGVLLNPLKSTDRLLVNTDRSGVSKAFKLGLSGGECIGDFAVSHAVSDILATGGTPFAISVAMLLPEETSVKTVDEIIEGVLGACNFCNVSLAGGDTKKAEKLSLVVTALGKAAVDEVLFRDTPEVGDQLVVTGELGRMLLGSAVYKQGIEVSNIEKNVLDDALVFQRPPYRLALEINQSKLANACTDISDGLQAACRNIVSSSGLGVKIEEDKIPVNPILLGLSKRLGLSAVQLSLAGGDWRFLYAVPKNSATALSKIAKAIGERIYIIGSVTATPGVWVASSDGIVYELNEVEHDSFIDRFDGKSYFDMLSRPINLYKKKDVRPL